MKSFIQYFVIVISLFGPKFGIFDSRILLVFIFLFLYRKDSVILTNNQIFLVVILFILTIYSFFLYALFPPYPEFLRYFRSIISLFCLPYIIGYRNNFETALNILVNSLLLHPLAIFLSMLFPNFYDLLAKIFQLVTQMRELRYSGLTAGYDIAGYLSISGFLICIFVYLFSKKKSILLKAILFYFSVFFTSRTSIILVLLLTLIIFYIIFKRNKITTKKIIYLILFFSILFGFLNKYIIPNLVTTIDIEILKDLSDKGNDDAVFIYAKTDPFQMFEDFIILPKTNLGVFFGENNLPLSDSGYIKAINSVGVLGLIITLFFYYKLYFTSKFFPKHEELRLNLSKAYTFILVIALILNTKNQYLFTRGSFELLILIYIIIQMKSKKQFI